MYRPLAISFFLSAATLLAQTQAPTPPAPAAANAGGRAARPQPPTRDPHTPGYVTAKELPDGEVPSPKVDGNFIIGPTHNPAPEMTVTDVPQGTIINFTMESTDSTSSSGTGCVPGLNSSNPRSVARRWLWSSTAFV